MMTLFSPHSTIGILGGGQLGRMLSMAAARLGYKCHIYCPQADNPAALISAAFTCAAYDDEVALEAFAKAVDVVTLEFENIPVKALELLARHVPVHPGARALGIAQDRLDEKDFLNRIGISTAPYAAVETLAAAKDAVTEIGLPAVLKTRRFGYDGKGQAIIHAFDEVAAGWKALASDRVIVEGFVNYTMEISVVAARNPDGEISSYIPVENRHKNHILAKTIAPADISPNLAAEAEDIAQRVIEALDYVGVLGVEMFVCDTEPHLLVNEIAPRVHNSGHWTIEACSTSQFEQQIRAVCGLPLGSTRRYGDAVMTNLIGEDIDNWRTLLSQQGVHFHDYGKNGARPGRKMGHITRVYPFGGKP